MDLNFIVRSTTAPFYRQQLITNSQTIHNSTKSFIQQSKKCFIRIKKNSYSHQHALEKNEKHRPAPPPCIRVLAQKQAVCVVLSYILGVDEEKKQKEAGKIKTIKKKSLRRRKK
jgi:hypothetical protein